MKISIDREAKLVRVMEGDCDSSGWLGFEFAKQHPELCEWGPFTFYSSAEEEDFLRTTKGDEEHCISFFSGEMRAEELGRIIKAGPPPPPAPKHDCPSCECKPECCN